MTFDVGAHDHAVPKLSRSPSVGTNLRDLHNSNATQGVGYGVAVIPIHDLVLAADGFTSFTPDNQTRTQRDQLHGGRRADIGREVRRPARGWLRRRRPATATCRPAFRRVSEVGAIDVGIRQDVVIGAGSRRATVVAVSLRLFIPGQPSLTPPGTL